MRLMLSSATFSFTGGWGAVRCLFSPVRPPAQSKPLPRFFFIVIFRHFLLISPLHLPSIGLATSLSPPTACLFSFFTSLRLSTLTLRLPLSLFASLVLSHCHLVLTPSPQSLHSSSPGDEVQLFDGVLPLVGESHPSGVGVAADRPHPASASTVAPVGVPATVHAHLGHGGGAAVVVVAWRRMGVHLDHVVAIHGRRDADVLLRLGLLVVAEPAHGGHHPASSCSVTSAGHQTHRHQLVLQTVR